MKTRMNSKTKNIRAGLKSNRNKRRIPYYRNRSRAGTSSGQPALIRFYLNPMLDDNGSVDRKKIVKLFNTESYG